MAPTLRTVLSLPGCPVLLRVGSDALDRSVRWVAVSELEDPTPYLQGGELLLTTGIRLTPRRCDAYVRRLVDAGVVALGLGVGLTHATVPAELVTAAERYGLPLLEVPEPTPFIAISKAVSDVLAAAEYEAVTRAVEVQRDLTRAALETDGAQAVVRRLAKELGADVLLLDPQGRVEHASAGAGPVLVGPVQAEVERMRVRGGRSSAAFSDADRSVVVQPLAPAGRVRGYLAVGRPAPFGTVDHSLVMVTVALVSSLLERGVASVTALRGLRSAVLSLLLDDVPAERLPLVSVGWADLGPGTVQLLAATGPADAVSAALDTLEDHAGTEGSAWAATLEDRLVVVVPSADEVLVDLVALAPSLAWGASEPVGPHQLSEGLRQAGLALQPDGGPGLRRFGDLGRHGVAALVDEASARGFAESLLGPLAVPDRGDLVASTRAWLAHHGQWDAAAASLGVHRHTMRHRMRRVEELLGRSLDDPDLRADLWVALTIRDRYETEH